MRNSCTARINSVGSAGPEVCAAKSTIAPRWVSRDRSDGCARENGRRTDRDHVTVNGRACGLTIGGLCAASRGEHCRQGYEQQTYKKPRFVHVFLLLNFCESNGRTQSCRAARRLRRAKAP